MPQAALEYAAQKSQVAATDIMFSTRHNNWADKMQPQISLGTVGGMTCKIQYIFGVTCVCVF